MGLGVRVPPFAPLEIKIREKTLNSKSGEKVRIVKTNVVEKGKWERELEVEVPAERVETEFTRACKHYQKRLEVPGFRKGKVPLNMVRRRYGDAIRSEVINDLLPSLLEEATRENGLVPAAPPRIDKLDHEPGQALTFTAVLDIWPEIEVEQYENLKVTKVVHESTEEEIEEQLKEIQARQATERSVERSLERGDVLIADLQRLDEGGLPIIGEKYEERYFIIGSENAPSLEFEEGVLGIQPGEERGVHFSYRDDLPNEELAGKQEHFSVTAREVREREVPELDDEFAKDLGEQFHSLEDLRQHIADQITQRWEFMARQKLHSDLIDEMIKQNPFELPESLVENHLRSLHEHEHEREHEHEHEHESIEKKRTTAVRQLRSFLLIEAVRKKAGIEVGEEEFEGFLHERAEELAIKPADLKRSERLENLRREFETNKVLDFLGERAEIKEETI